VLSCRLAAEGVALTQKDIRNIQLAKGASLAAAQILLREASCRAEEIDLVMIAGAFGENLNIDNSDRSDFSPISPTPSTALWATQVSRRPNGVRGSGVHRAMPSASRRLSS
jgi:hypothetical protein